ncbi:MAG: GNAT family N-acetyltransferase [Alphaproteobacteria bacterium]|nr:GNAT family N-acetyltransferase [Alphaproteobacteria bacterium]NDC56678.1 GNAT family N-acetyltransferase [Alphaproteobacteria bacterium]NDG04937.1 GNAT family N-acetyltransferase [Alphaproteobacteria bacterium]
MDYTFFCNGFVSLIIVSKNHRRKGVGKKLLEHFVGECKTQKLFTSANQSNHGSRSLFISLGFMEVGIVNGLDENDPEIFYLKKVL